MAGVAAVFARKGRTQTDTTTRSFFEWWDTGPFDDALEAERLSAPDAEATRRGLMLEDLGLDVMVARCTPMAPQRRAELVARHWPRRPPGDEVARRSAAFAAEMLVNPRITPAARADVLRGPLAGCVDAWERVADFDLIPPSLEAAFLYHPHPDVAIAALDSTATEPAQWRALLFDWRPAVRLWATRRLLEHPSHARRIGLVWRAGDEACRVAVAHHVAALLNLTALPGALPGALSRRARWRLLAALWIICRHQEILRNLPGGMLRVAANHPSRRIAARAAALVTAPEQ